MKYITFLFIVCLLAACSSKDDPESRNCESVDYEAIFEVQLYDEVCFPNENSFKVEEIIFNFCPCEVLCDWEGELNIKLSTINKDEELQELTVGTSTIIYGREIFDGYKISEIRYEYEGGEVPLCEEDFDAEKVTLSMIVTN